MRAPDISLQAAEPAAHASRTALRRTARLVALGAVCALTACNRSKSPAAAARPKTPAPAPAAPAADTLPSGISDVRFGRVERGQSAATGQTCRIARPLPEPTVFPAATRELAFTARLDPEIVKDADAWVTGPDVPEVRGTGCNAYGVSGGRVQQVQMGSSFIRSDGTPWPSGEYTLSIRVNGASVSLPFRVE
jgi:hypothetical protein